MSGVASPVSPKSPVEVEKVKLKKKGVVKDLHDNFSKLMDFVINDTNLRSMKLELNEASASRASMYPLGLMPSLLTPQNGKSIHSGKISFNTAMQHSKPRCTSPTYSCSKNINQSFSRTMLRPHSRVFSMNSKNLKSSGPKMKTPKSAIHGQFMKYQ